MSPIVPFRSALSTMNRWPSIWDDEDFQFLSPSSGNDIDVYEADNEVVVRANVAGVPADDVDVTFEKGVLWIKATATKEEEDKKNKYYSQASWDYSYKLAVPGMIDMNKEPEVTLDDGVLTARFPKSEASKPKKLTINKKK